MVDRLVSGGTAEPDTPPEEFGRPPRHQGALYDTTYMVGHGLLSDEERERLAKRLEAVQARPSLPPLNGCEPGAYLRQCREKLGLKVTDLCKLTRIRETHFESIENVCQAHQNTMYTVVLQMGGNNGRADTFHHRVARSISSEVLTNKMIV